MKSQYVAGNEPHMLKRLFDLYAEETISSEQEKRVLGSLRRMIDEGRFDRQFRSAQA